MDEYSDRIRQIATIYEAQDYAVTKSLLEANGILVLGASQNFVMASARPDSSGGTAIMVPERQAQQAINLLLEVDGLNQASKPVHVTPVKQRPKGIFRAIRDMFVHNALDRDTPAPVLAMRREIHGEWKKLDTEF